MNQNSFSSNEIVSINKEKESFTTKNLILKNKLITHSLENKILILKEKGLVALSLVNETKIMKEKRPIAHFLNENKHLKGKGLIVHSLSS